MPGLCDCRAQTACAIHFHVLQPLVSLSLSNNLVWGRGVWSRRPQEGSSSSLIPLTVPSPSSWPNLPRTQPILPHPAPSDSISICSLNFICKTSFMCIMCAKSMCKLRLHCTLRLQPLSAQAQMYPFQRSRQLKAASWTGYA
jgi:hypothetical protein